MRRLTLVSMLAAGIAVSLSAAAQDAQTATGDGCVVLDKVVVGDIEIGAPWARATRPGQANAGGYVTIVNRGTEDDRLVHASSPRAGRTEIHSMEIVDDVMSMRPLEGGLELPAGETVRLQPGGLHLMLIDVAAPLGEGESIPVTVEFEKAGPAELSFVVRSASYGRGGHDHSAGADAEGAEVAGVADDCAMGQQAGHGGHGSHNH